MKIINIKDLNKKILYLDEGEYLINGKRYSFPKWHDNKIELEELNELKKINTTTVIIKYYDEINQKEKTVTQYLKEKKDLLEKGHEEYDDDGYDIVFDNLDDEYNYKKFIQTNKAIYNTIETFSKNLIPPEEVVTYKTNNPYIESCYFTEKDCEPTLYKYNRGQAYLDIVKNKFNQLGFEFVGDCDYNQTKNQKIWGNSEHSCIRYVKAFGSYLFNDSFNIHNPFVRGTLEDVLEKYEKDKKTIEGIIQRKYNENFATLNQDKLQQLPELINEMEYRLNKISPKKDSWTHYRICAQKLNEIQTLISESFIQEEG